MFPKIFAQPCKYVCELSKWRWGRGEVEGRRRNWEGRRSASMERKGVRVWFYLHLLTFFVAFQFFVDFFVEEGEFYSLVVYEYCTRRTTWWASLLLLSKPFCFWISPPPKSPHFHSLFLSHKGWFLGKVLTHKNYQSTHATNNYWGKAFPPLTDEKKVQYRGAKYRHGQKSVTKKL